MNGVVDLEARDLPRVSLRDAVALTRAARVVARLPRRVELALGELGEITLVIDGLEALGSSPERSREDLRDDSPERASGGDVAFGLTRGAGVGRLVIDGALARRVIALALGASVRPGAPLARLGLGERGIVAGVVASLLQALGAPFSVALAAPSGVLVSRAAGVALALGVTIAGAAGWARLELPSSWLEVTAFARDPELETLELEVRVELACTRLAAGELAGVVPGDAIVFDGEPSEPSLARGGGDRSVRVVVGAHVARARLHRDARVILEEALGPAAAVPGFGAAGGGRGYEEVTMETRDEDAGDTKEIGSGAPEGTAAAMAALAEAPLEVVAELGRLILRGEEIVGLGPGSVLTLGRAGTSPVTLRVAGEAWAEGELVDVDGELGVRVTASRRSGLPRRSGLSRRLP